MDIIPVGNRFKFNSDGKFVIALASGSSKTGVWGVNANGQLVFYPGQEGGMPFGISNAILDIFTGKMIKPSGLSSVTSLYEIIWVSAQ